MTNQEIFRDVVCAIVMQGRKSSQPGRVSGTNVCSYRGANGAKCAAGHLIPDEAYVPSMEGKIVCGDRSDVVVGTLRGEFATCLPWTMEQDQLVRDLQKAHDSTLDVEGLDFVSQFVGGALQVADKHHIYGTSIVVEALRLRADNVKLALQGALVEKPL